jgi:hypothetical protein
VHTLSIFSPPSLSLIFHNISPRPLGAQGSQALRRSWLFSFAPPPFPVSPFLPRTNTLLRTAPLRPGFSPLGRHSTSACVSALIRYRVLRSFALGSHPWAPQHVRVFSRTNTLSRITRYSPLGSNPSGPTARSRAFARQYALAYCAFFALGYHPLGATARPRVFAHKYASRIARNRLGL